MKKFLSFAIIATLLNVSFSACDNEPDSPLTIVVGQAIDGENFVVGQILTLPIKVVASSESLSQFTIETYDKENGLRQIENMPISGTLFEHTFYISIPEIKVEALEMQIILTAKLSSGYTRTITRNIFVTNSEEVLEIRSGVTLYCSAGTSDNPDAYCFSEMRPIIKDLAYPELVDLYFPNPDENDPKVKLIREFRTMTDMNFARNNSFDFANATSISITASYASSVRNPKVANLHAGDIILVGRGPQAVGVIQIVDIIEGQSLTQSRYILNIKAIDSALTPITPEPSPEPQPE